MTWYLEAGTGSEEGTAGWGGRDRTSDHGIKTRCLTTWLRPSGVSVINTDGILRFLLEPSNFPGLIDIMLTADILNYFIHPAKRFLGVVELLETCQGRMDLSRNKERIYLVNMMPVP